MRRKLRSFLLGIPLFVPICLPQENILQQPAFRSQSNVVLVPTLVKSENGDLVYGLQAGDFIVEDDGVEQIAQLDESQDGQPVSLMIAIQTGRRAAREFARMRGLRSVLEPVIGGERVESALIFFDSKVNLAVDFTEHSDAISKPLQTLTPGDGGAAILDAVNLSVKLLSKRPESRRRVLLLISETRDHGSKSASDLRTVISHVGESNISVYALSFSPSRSQVLDTMRGANRDEGRTTADLMAPLVLAANGMKKNVLRTIASMTGGEYESFATLTGFESRMTAFNNHLYNRYVLSFQPKNPRAGLHEIRVRLRTPGKDTVMARRNYWAAASSGIVPSAP